MPTVLKLVYKDDVRRLILQDTEVTFETVKSKICSAWPSLPTYVAKYTDEEGDLCTLCEASFLDFVSVSKTCCKNDLPGNQVILRLEIYELETVQQDCDSTRSQVGTSASPSQAETSNPAHTLAEEEETEDWQRYVRNWDWPWNHSHDHHEHDWWWSSPDLLAKHGKGPETWFLRPKKCLHLASKLRSSGALSGRVVAGFLAHALPALVELIANHVYAYGQLLCDKLPKFKSILSDLLTFMEAKQDMTSAVSAVVTILALEKQQTAQSAVSCHEVAGQALLELLVSLASLCFEDQITFFESFYVTQEAKLHQLLDNDWAPCWTDEKLLHHNVTCDGCGMSPLRGFRFRCNSCCDYDLCGECFAAKTTVHVGDNVHHDFTYVPCTWKQHHVPFDPWHAAWKGPWGKVGKGKSKGEHKGKGWWKGGHGADHSSWTGHHQNRCRWSTSCDGYGNSWKGWGNKKG